MRYLVTGAGGILGTELRHLAAVRGLDLIGLDRSDLDVTDADAVVDAVEGARPDVVIHAAAYTAVDRAESEPERARRVNVDGSAHVAAAAARAGATVVYVSTDFVFDGRAERPYRPDDPTGPAGVYGRTKLAGEDAVRGAAAEHLVVRTSWVYGRGGRNFVDAILERARTGQALRVVQDQRGRPTWAANLARGLVDLAVSGARGTWHLTDGGPVTTWYGLAAEALRLAGLEVPLAGVSTEEWGAPAPRPAYSALDVRATEERLGRAMPPWPEALAAYLAVPPGEPSG